MTKWWNKRYPSLDSLDKKRRDNQETGKRLHQDSLILSGANANHPKHLLATTIMEINETLYDISVLNIDGEIDDPEKVITDLEEIATLVSRAEDLAREDREDRTEAALKEHDQYAESTAKVREAQRLREAEKPEVVPLKKFKRKKKKVLGGEE